jgi:cytochrome c
MEGATMKVFSVLATVLILSMVPFMASADDATAVELVNRAVALWQKKGADYTVKVINASAGPLKKGPMYTFAINFKGVVIAHPAQTDLRGKNMADVPDAEGKYMTRDMIALAQSPEGSGWVEYKWKRVNDTQPTTKRTFAKRIPGEEAFVACGYYLK